MSLRSLPRTLCVAACCLLLAAAAAVAAAPMVAVRFALRQPDVAGLERALYAVSSPFSPETYGRHLTHEEVARFVGTAPRDLQQLQRWLVSDVHADPNSIRVHATRDYVDAMLPAKLAAEIVGDAGQRQRERAAGAAAAPHGLGGRHGAHRLAQRFIDFAFYTGREENARMLRVSREAHGRSLTVTRLPTRRERMRQYAAKMTAKKQQAHKTNSLDAPQDNSGTPANQRAAYGVPASLECTNPKNLQMVWGTGTYGFTPSDLQQYYAEMNLPASQINQLVVTDFYGQEGGDNWGEGTLDVSLISGLATGVRTLVSNTDTSESSEEGDGFGPAMLAWITGLVNNATGQGQQLPLVISLSLGSLSWDSCNLLCEGVAAMQGQKVSYAECQAYMQQQRQVCMYPDSAGIDRLNTELMKVGALGTSVMAATGDGGSHFSFQFFNPDRIGNLLNQVACAMNSPTFPAESPYVTGVGGTDWEFSSPTAPLPWGASGGGFSWRFPRPSYQQAAVEKYFATVGVLPPASAYNSSNRAYPDVAALATNVPVVFSGSISPASGTSCSAPEFSALVTLLNDVRLNKGLAPLGFLNPLLYALAGNASVYSTVFYDMDTGSSDCDGNGMCCGKGTGFKAAKDWDPTTGLGSPLFAGLQQHLTNNDFLTWMRA